MTVLVADYPPHVLRAIARIISPAPAPTTGAPTGGEVPRTVPSAPCTPPVGPR